MSRQLAKHWISVDVYERMGEAGVFHTDARLELLEGSIDELPHINPMRSDRARRQDLALPFISERNCCRCPSQSSLAAAAAKGAKRASD